MTVQGFIWTSPAQSTLTSSKTISVFAKFRTGKPPGDDQEYTIFSCSDPSESRRPLYASTPPCPI